MEPTNPPILLLAALVPALFVVWLVRSRRGPRVEASTVASFETAPSTFRRVLHRYLVCLQMLVLTLFLVSLSMTTAERVRYFSTTEATDILFVLDVSSSMASRDLGDASRLEIAKDLIGQFIVGRPTDRLGLVAFSRYSTLLCPLTLNHDLLVRQLANVELATGDDDGTAIGMALASAAVHLKESAAKSRTIVLLTDGDNNRSTVDPITAANIAQALGLQIQVIGVGNGLSEVTGHNPGDENEYEIAPAINAAMLENIAAVGGGTYFSASARATLAEVFRNLDRMERSVIEAERYEGTRTRINLLALLAFLVAITEGFARYVVVNKVP